MLREEKQFFKSFWYVSREARARNPPYFSDMLDPCSQKNDRTRVKNVSKVHRIQCGDVKKGKGLSLSANDNQRHSARVASQPTENT